MRRILIIAVFLLAFVSVIFSEPDGSTGASEKNQQELTFWGIYDLPEVYQPVIDTYEKEHPDITIRYRQFPNAEEYHQVLMKQIERGEGPDIFLFSHDQKEELISYINPTHPKWGEGFAALAQNDLTENRLLYGLPLWLDSLMIYYNKQSYPNGIPVGWYEFAELTQSINMPGVAMGRLDNLSFGWDILKTLFLQKGVEPVLSPEAAGLYDTLEFFTRFAYPIDPFFNWSEALNKDYPDNEIDSFVRKKVAAIAGYSSLMEFLSFKVDQLTEKNLRHMKKEDIGVALFPQINPDDPKYLAKYMALGVSIHSSAPNLAWDFVRLLTDKTHAAYYFEATGRTPGRILPFSPEDTELKSVQKLQVQNSSVMEVPEEFRIRIEDVVSKALKNKKLLREIVEEGF